ncbi:MAG: FG-GAP-like repeat-containing protein, partial [Halieaceae bacterium]|nr:FG-GAP-like repeat-containing protein [Halieaceae bacterium]
MRTQTFLMAIGTALSIASCGGGGGETASSSSPPNQAPIVEQLETQILSEQFEYTVSVNANDIDGRIVSYEWTQISGEPLSLTDANSASLGIITPAIDGDSSGELEISVTDDDGATTTQTIEFSLRKFPSITIKNLIVDEGDDDVTSVEVIFELDREAIVSASVDYSLSGVDAAPSVDYEAQSGSVTFSTGNSSKTIVVKVIGDEKYENDEGIEVHLSSPVRVLTPPQNAVITIKNDDPRYSLIRGDATTEFSYLPDFGKNYTGIPAYAFLSDVTRHSIIKQYISTSCFGDMPRCGDKPYTAIYSFDKDSGSLVDTTTDLFVDGVIPEFEPFREAVVADLNGDGFEDVAFANHTEGYVRYEPPEYWQSYDHVLMSVGGGFYELKRLSEYKGYTHSIAAGDIDNDGDIDLYMGTTGPADDPADNGKGGPFEGGFFLLNDGLGNFTRHPQRFNYGHASHLVDLTGDGQLELVTTEADNSCTFYQCVKEWGIAIYQRQNNGLYEKAVSSLNSLPDAVVTGEPDEPWTYDYNGSTLNLAYMGDVINQDINNDGLQDLIVLTNTNVGPEFLSVLLNKGGLEFEVNTSYLPFYHEEANTLFLKSVDVDQDDNKDILIQRVNGVFSQQLYGEIFFGSGEGSYVADNRLELPEMTGTLEPADADMDG